MTIPHFSVGIIARSAGRSVVMSAAYRHCARMEFEREARQIDCSRKSGLVHEEFAIPPNAPGWVRMLASERTVAGTSEAFWNRLEAFERRADAQLAKDVTIALPRELTRDQNIALVREFVDVHITSKGMVADWVFHEPGPTIDLATAAAVGTVTAFEANNPHIHLMTTLRPLTEDGFGAKKVPVLSMDGKPLRNDAGKIVYALWSGDVDDFQAFRDGWFACLNRHLALAGLDMRVDGRSFEKQGIELVPTIHLGVETNAIERKAAGSHSQPFLDRAKLQEAVRAENARRIVANPKIVIDTVAREKSVFNERDLAKVLSRYLDDAHQFQSVLACLLQHPELLRLDRERVDFKTGHRQPTRYTTRDMLKLEAEMIARAHWLSRQNSHRVRRSHVDQVVTRHHSLSEEQRTALEHLGGRARIAVVIGRAGTGKTTMMKAAREAWEKAGYHVVGGALAGKAAEGLEKEAAIRSLTLSSWELRWQHGRDGLDEKTVFVLDEAGMVSSRQMAKFVQVVAESGAKLILVGDPDQLQPIEAGAAFRAIADRIGYAELETIYRQRKQWMRDASLDLARGSVGKALEAYEARGRLISDPFKAQAVSRLIDDWARDYDPTKTSLILAHLRRDVRQLNEMARGRLIAAGLVSKGAAFQTSQGPRMFAAGDQVVFLRNEISIGVKNGMLGKVLEASQGWINVQVGQGEDRRRIAIDQKVYNDLDIGYATTIHKAQGATVDRVKVLASLSLDRHLTYVAMTRHREDLEVYYGRRSFDRNGGLTCLLSRRHAKETTLDYAERGLYHRALRFAEARGLHIVGVARTLVRDRLDWIVRQREKLLDLSTRMARLQETLRRLKGIIGGPAGDDLNPKPMVEGIKQFSQSLDHAVEERLTRDPALTTLWGEVSTRIRHVYAQPEMAFAAMDIGSALVADHARTSLLDALVSAPGTFGVLRGNSGIFASRADRANHQRALEQVTVLAASLGEFFRARTEAQLRYGAEVEALRHLLAIDIPALSEEARRVLEKVSDAIYRNDVAASAEFESAEKVVRAELEDMVKAVARRFGQSSFLSADAMTADSKSLDSLRVGMNTEQQEALRQVWPALRAVQRLSEYRRALPHKRETELRGEQLAERKGLFL